jgi:hypothetical protein
MHPGRSITSYLGGIGQTGTALAESTRGMGLGKTMRALKTNRVAAPTANEMAAWRAKVMKQRAAKSAAAEPPLDLDGTDLTQEELNEIGRLLLLDSLRETGKQLKWGLKRPFPFHKYKPRTLPERVGQYAPAALLGLGGLGYALHRWNKGKRKRKTEEKEAMDKKAYLKGFLVKLAKKDMPSFTEQDRPEKVKDIYRALKRDHPDMPAEMKARIASRQGKPGKQKQGPPYKGKLTKKSAAQEAYEEGFQTKVAQRLGMSPTAQGNPQTNWLQNVARFIPGFQAARSVGTLASRAATPRPGEQPLKLNPFSGWDLMRGVGRVAHRMFGKQYPGQQPMPNLQRLQYQRSMAGTGAPFLQQRGSTPNFPGTQSGPVPKQPSRNMAGTGAPFLPKPNNAPGFGAGNVAGRALSNYMGATRSL